MAAGAIQPVEVHVSLVGRKRLTAEIYSQLRLAIVEGRLARGDRLPATREVARQLAVSRTTVMEVYDRLLSEGYLEARTGAGTFVSAEFAPAGRNRTPSIGALRAADIWATGWLPRAFDEPAEYDFRAGVPDTTLFPFDAWRRIQAREWRPAAARKGVPGEPAGDAGLREAIARHVSVARGVRASGDDVIVTNGTQQAADVIARTLLRPGDVVAVEDPGYPPPRLLFTTLGLRVAGVRVDREGLVVDEIPADARLVFVSPSHQFPLGTAMSLRRRLALLQWAESHDAAILEDDYDSEFRLTGRPIEPLQMLDRSGRVIYVGTFSKSMLVTLRLGFVVVPASIRHAAHVAKFVTDWHTSLPAQRALAAFIGEGWFARHVRRMRPVYRERHARIEALLRRMFADELDVLPSATGVHLAAIARRRSADQIAEVVRRARENGVAVQELASFAVGSDRTAGLLFGYGAIALEDVDEGLRRLRLAFSGPRGERVPSRRSPS
jgi:GntR family transcriptional regulator/MocR family aminotransferase